jgi:two-component system sensor histidine kinase MprB
VSRTSIVSRVTRGTVLASLITAVTLAAAAATLTFWLWRVREERALRQTVVALAEAVEREALDEKWPVEKAAPEAIRESSVTGYRIEVWAGDRLLAANLNGPPVGPDAQASPPAGWLVAQRALEGDLRILVAAPTRGGEALRVFAWSLVLAMPLCLGVALMIGRFVGRRATQPLVEFKGRIVAARAFEPLPDRGIPGAPSEVRELDEAFRALWRGLREALAREVEFAANASHELRTPLTRIRLHAERAKADAGPLAKAQLAELTAEVDRMVRLVESLLVLARDVSAGIPRTEVVNMADAVRTAIARTLGSGRADGTGLPDEALVRGDEDLLGIAVENLLENAGKFSAPGRAVRLSLGERDGRVRLTVTSPGARITAAEHDLLFERFYRSPEARVAQPGHGIGLPLARHVARLHGGDVACLSSPEQDACFELDLPAWTAGQAG